MKKLARLSFVVAATAAALVSIQSPSSPQGEAARYEVDPVHTSVIFRIGHLGISKTYGRFDDVSGTVDLGGSNAVSITVQAASVDTGNEKRDNHLRSPDFLSVKEFPTISFKSSAWKKTGDDVWDVTGTLTLHGTTKEITIPVEKTGEGKTPMGDYRIGFESTFDLERTDYGMTKMVGPVGDDVRLIIAVEAIRK